MKILVVDVGNTSTSFGLYAGGRVSHVSRLDSKHREPKALLRALRAIPGIRALDGAIVASVVPARIALWKKTLKEVCEIRPLIVSHKLELGIPVTYPKPETIGADRLANAVGAAHAYGMPVLVADFGTALTFDIVTAREGYAGGIIAPGLPLMFDYLAEKTALLPHVEPAAIRKPVGKSTEEAIRLGARWGYVGMVKEILARLREGLHLGACTVCATGGHAAWVLKGLDEPVIIDRHLTLKGLGRIYELNGSAC